jgi:Protein tyrosine and serine/threonine kinase
VTEKTLKAPEVFREGKYYQKSDVYQFGMFMWGIWTSCSFPYVREDVSGRLVEDTENLESDVTQEGRRRWHPSRRGHICDGRVSTLITRSWSQKLDERPTMHDVKEELDRLYAALAASTVSKPLAAAGWTPNRGVGDKAEDPDYEEGNAEGIAAGVVSSSPRSQNWNSDVKRWWGSPTIQAAFISLHDSLVSFQGNHAHDDDATVRWKWARSWAKDMRRTFPCDNMLHDGEESFKHARALEEARVALLTGLREVIYPLTFDDAGNFRHRPERGPVLRNLAEVLKLCIALDRANCLYVLTIHPNARRYRGRRGLSWFPFGARPAHGTNEAVLVRQRQQLDWQPHSGTLGKVLFSLIDKLDLEGNFPKADRNRFMSPTFLADPDTETGDEEESDRLRDLPPVSNEMSSGDLYG